MAHYYALTTTNPQEGWMPLDAHGTDRARVTARAHKLIGEIRTDYGTDIVRETEHKNLHIVPASKLHRYGWNTVTLEAHLDRIAENDAAWDKKA